MIADLVKNAGITGNSEKTYKIVGIINNSINKIEQNKNKTDTPPVNISILETKKEPSTLESEKVFLESIPSSPFIAISQEYYDERNIYDFEPYKDRSDGWITELGEYGEFLLEQAHNRINLHKTQRVVVVSSHLQSVIDELDRKVTDFIDDAKTYANDKSKYREAAKTTLYEKIAQLHTPKEREQALQALYHIMDACAPKQNALPDQNEVLIAKKFVENIKQLINTVDRQLSKKS